MLLALMLAGLEVTNACERAGADDRSERRREDEAGRIGANCVDAGPAGSDVAAHQAEALRHRRLDNVDLVHRIIALGDARAMWSVHADGVNLVDIGQRTVFLGKIANIADRRDIAIHGINGFECHDLRNFRPVFLKQAFEVLQIVMAPDALGAAALPDALDHGGVVLLV